MSPVSLWSSPGKASLTSRILIAGIHSVVQWGTGDSGVQGMLTSECPSSCRQSASCSLRWPETKLDFIKSLLSGYLTNGLRSLFLLGPVQINLENRCCSKWLHSNIWHSFEIKTLETCFEKLVELFMPLAVWKATNFGCSLRSKEGW